VNAPTRDRHPSPLRYLFIYLAALLLSFGLVAWASSYGRSHEDLIYYAPSVVVTLPISALMYVGMDHQPDWASYVWLALGAATNAAAVWWFGSRKDRAG
jgi:hypothetical protein